VCGIYEIKYCARGLKNWNSLTGSVSVNFSGGPSKLQVNTLDMLLHYKVASRVFWKRSVNIQKY
jgi:hypothetical protein